MAQRAGVNTINQSEPTPELSVLKGYVSRTREAPKAFSDPVWVVIPGYSTEAPLRCDEWGAIHGNTLPVQGTPVTIVIDDDDIPTVVGWKGEHS